MTRSIAEPGRILHVFPYDPGHLGQTFGAWAPSQVERWPLAAMRLSRFASRSTVHVIGPSWRRFSAPPLEIVQHPSLFSGPRWRDWGDDWSTQLEWTLGRLRSDDVCVIHLNDYAAARLAQRAARRSRAVIVFHGRGLGCFDAHLANAERLVVLRRDAADALVARGASRSQVALFPPSVDGSRFAPGEPHPLPGGQVLGFVGRLEPAKGVLEIPAVLARLAANGLDARVELAGPSSSAQRQDLVAAATRAGVLDRIEILGEISADDVAERMRSWRLLLLPSQSEGHPIVALEACASRLPVAAVEGVLPAELEERPAVSVAPREHYASLVSRLLSESHRPAPDDWVRSHETAAAEWDELIETLPEWTRRASAPVSRLRRARRFRPPRRLARAVLRRG